VIKNKRKKMLDINHTSELTLKMDGISVVGGGATGKSESTSNRSWRLNLSAFRNPFDWRLFTPHALFEINYFKEYMGFTWINPTKLIGQ